MARTRPYIKFYGADWRADAGLRLCSYAAKGLWIGMICLMQDADPFGHLVVNGKPLNEKQLAALLGGSEAEVKRLVAELESNGVFSRLADGTIYCRRMLRDLAKEEADAVNGRKGGNPRLSGYPAAQPVGLSGGLTPPLKPTPTTTPIAKVKEESVGVAEAPPDQNLSVAKPADPKGTRWPDGQKIPDDWLKLASDKRAAHKLAPVDLRREAEIFERYWASKPGKDGRKTNWRSTWITWILKANGNARQPWVTERTTVESAFAGLEVRAAAAAERAGGAGWRQSGANDFAGDVWAAEEDPGGSRDLVRVVG